MITKELYTNLLKKLEKLVEKMRREARRMWNKSITKGETSYYDFRKWYEDRCKGQKEELNRDIEEHNKFLSKEPRLSEAINKLEYLVLGHIKPDVEELLGVYPRDFYIICSTRFFFPISAYMTLQDEIVLLPHFCIYDIVIKVIFHEYIHLYTHIKIGEDLLKYYYLLTEKPGYVIYKVRLEDVVDYYAKRFYEVYTFQDHYKVHFKIDRGTKQLCKRISNLMIKVLEEEKHY